MNTRIKKGDEVKVLAGKDRGKTGKVLEVVDQTRVLVENVNFITRHRRQRSAREKGTKLQKPASVDISNVMLICSSCGKPSRVSISISANGEKSRICKRCGGAI